MSFNTPKVGKRAWWIGQWNDCTVIQSNNIS